MLWNAISASTSNFFNWETYAAGLIYFSITFGAAILFIYFSRSISLLTVYMFILQPCLHALATVIFLIIIAPIALGFGTDGAWGLPIRLVTSAPWDFAMTVGLVAIFSMALAFAPVVGALPSFHSLILEVFALDLIFKLVGVQGISRADMMPNFWIGVGILAFGTIASWIGTMISAFLASVASLLSGGHQDGIGTLLIFPVIATLGLAPLIVYMAWLGLKYN